MRWREHEWSFIRQAPLTHVVKVVRFTSDRYGATNQLSRLTLECGHATSRRTEYRYVVGSLTRCVYCLHLLLEEDKKR